MRRAHAESTIAQIPRRSQKYPQSVAIEEVRAAKRELLQKIITHDSDNYIGHILHRNRINANNSRLKSIVRPVYGGSQAVHSQSDILNEFLHEKPKVTFKTSSSRRIEPTLFKSPSLRPKESKLDIFERGRRTRTTQNQEESIYTTESGVKRNLALETLVFSLRDRPAERTRDKLQALFEYLQGKNPLFGKIDSSLAICLLKIGAYSVRAPGELVFKRKENKRSFFILLEGVVSLFNELLDFKKLCFTGDSLGEEMLFNDGDDMSYLESSKVITRAFLLEIKVKDYLLLKRQLRKYCSSEGLAGLEEELRDNFTEKNLSRNDALLKQGQF